MAEQTITAGIQIKADVAGAENINRLSDTLRQTSGETSELAIQAQKLQHEWQQSQANLAMIEQYRSLKSALADNRQELTQTEQKMRLLSAQMQNGATQKQTKQYNDLGKQVAALNTQKRALLGSLKSVSDQMNTAGISSKTLAAQQKELTEKASLAEQELIGLTAQAKKLQAIAAAKTTLGIDTDEKAHAEIAKIRQAYLLLKQDGGLSHQELARAAALQKDKIYTLERSLKDLRPTLADVKDEIQGLVTHSGGLAYAAKEAIGFETAMAQVRKVTDGSEQDYAKLTQSIQDMAGEMGIVPQELAAIAAQGGQMGMALDKLPEYTRMTAQMANAFGISADAAAEMSAKISNVYGMNLQELGEFGDAVNTLGNTTAAKEAEIGEVMMRIGGNAKNFGLAANEAAALGAAFISLGKTPEVAGTAINALLSKLQTANVGTDDFKAGLKQLGLSADEMAAQIAANPQKALSDFLAKLQELDKQDRAELIGKMFGTEYADDVSLLTGSLKTYGDALDSVSDKSKTMGAMSAEAGKALETTQGQLNIAKSNIVTAAIQIGNQLLPVIANVAEAVGNTAGHLADFAQMFPHITQLAVLFAGAKVAVMAYQTAMKLSGAESQTSLLKTDVGITKLKTNLLETAMAARTVGANLRQATANGAVNNINGISGAVNTLRGNLGGLLGNLQLLAGAGLAGFELGTWARNNIDVVRDLGDELARLPAMAESLWDTGGLDKYRENFRTTKEAIKEIEQAEKAAKTAAEAKAAAEKKAGEEQAAVIQQLMQTRASLNEQIAANERSMVVLNEAGKTGSVIYSDLAAKNETLRQQLAATNVELGKQNAQISDSSPLLKQKQALESLGLTAEQVATGISQKAQQALNDFGAAGAQFGTDAQSMSRLFQAALQKMDSPEAVAKLKESLASVGKQAGLAEADIRAIGNAAPETADKVQAAFDKIGVDTKAVMSGISADAKQAMSDFQAASDAAKEQGVKDARLIAAGFEQMMAKLKSSEEFAAFKQQLEKSGDAAKLTSEQLNRLNAAAKDGAIAAKTAYEQLGASIKSASDTNGIQAAGQAAEQAMKRGEISAQQYQEVLKQVRERTAEIKQKSEETGKAQAQSHQKASQAAASATKASKEQAKAQEKTGEAAKKSADEHTKATRVISYNTDSVQYKINQLWRSMNPVRMGITADSGLGFMAYARFTYQIAAGLKAASKSINNLNTAMEKGTDISRALSAAQGDVAKVSNVLDSQTLKNYQSAIEAAKQKMKSLADEAVNARLQAQKELLKLQGKDDEISKMEQAQKIKELTEKQKEAEKQGNTKAADEYKQAILTNQRVFDLQRKKAREAEEEQWLKEEQQKREAAEREAQKTTQTQPEIKLPETSIDVGNLDLSGLTQQLSDRDKQLVAQVKQAIMSELMQQLKNRT